MTKIKILTTITLVAAISSTILFADCNKSSCKGMQNKSMECNMKDRGMDKHPKQNMKHRGEMRLFDDLNLTDAQKKSLRDLRSENKMDRKHEKMKLHGNAMEKSVSANGFNKAKFIEVSTRQFNERINKKAENMEKIFAILTPAQKAELNKRLHQKR